MISETKGKGELMFVNKVVYSCYRSRELSRIEKHSARFYVTLLNAS